MNEKSPESTEIKKLLSRLKVLEQKELKLIKAEEELQSANQQLEAGNQQLKASEQQLNALNQQLLANERELIEKETSSRQAREYAESIISTVREPLIILDGDLRVVSANKFFYTTFKVKAKETEAKLLYSLGNNQWNIPALKELLTKILPEKSVVENYEVKHTFENIGERIMLLNARELQQGGDKKRLILLSIQDTTQQRQAEEKLKHINSELEEKTDELQQILYIITHDLRSPLVNIQGFNREMASSLEELNAILKDNKSMSTRLGNILEEEIPESMHFITSSTHKMDALLTGLLALSRLGRKKTVFKRVNMNELMENVIDNFRHELDKNNVVLKVSDLPECRGDEFQLNQLFSNLVGNALKFLAPERPGKIKISGKIEKHYVKYEVEDNGIGIHPDHQEKVFELFHKLDPKKPGIGLGMNIVKQISESHKAKIELESKLDTWTKIIIFIPFK